MRVARAGLPEEISDIQMRMAQIRRDLHADVQVGVKGAQSITDWRRHVRSHPWLSLGTAAAIGYLIVPRRRSESFATATLAPSATPLGAVSAQEAAPPKSVTSWGVLATAFSLVAPIVVRGAQNYAVHYLEEWLKPTPRPSEGTRGPGRPTAPAAPTIPPRHDSPNAW